MFDVTRFLLRWSFLSNLCRDIGEIQTIPPQPYHPAPEPSFRHPRGTTNNAHNALAEERHWKDNCIRGVLSYPPGMQRALVLDAMRTELVEELAHEESVSSDDNRRGRLPEQQQQQQQDQQQTGLQTTRPRPSMRQYMPQLVSAVLKSAPSFQADLTDPIRRLRSLLLNKCLTDPSFGIELCWLLEAEVGRTWKKLFEHRQQTGRRLVVVLPADKAAVLAKIGAEKKEAFDLLQDAEQATAYGDIPGEEQENMPRLPSSISLLRCGHFGDTMHFIDQLGIISSRLRLIPPQHRSTVLENSLHELNRRIRRRMITRGDVSLDVEDHRGPYDWPLINDMSLNVIEHSFHLPLVPQTNVWPDGIHHHGNQAASPEPTDEVVRVLNIVVEESRLLSSRERCPMLLHVEVMDSGVAGSDARLYAKAVDNIGATIAEALGSNDLPFSYTEGTMNPIGIPTHVVPEELLEARDDNYSWTRDEAWRDEMAHDKLPRALDHEIPRGGSQTEADGFPYQYGGNQVYYADQSSYENENDNTPLTHFHQTGYEQMPRQLQVEKPVPKILLGKDLLDQVFGHPWTDKCREIREASPYGNIKGWRLASFIMKAGEDIRREAFVMQIIKKMRQWFNDEMPEAFRPYLRPYTIMCVGGDAGLVECLSDAKSLDEVKKKTDGFTTLLEYFERAYGPPAATKTAQQAAVKPLFGVPRSHRAPFLPSSFLGPTQHGKSISFEAAQENFLKSLVGYSLVCYVLQIKDRHNANLLLDRLGHIMHIDFGFVLGDTPKMGKVPLFSERAPFKLSTEIWEVIGGWREGGVRFCQMFEIAFTVASRHVDEIATLAESTMLSLDSDARQARSVAHGVRSRLRMRGPPGSREQKMFIADLVNAALSCWGTSTYDWLQRNMNGYL